MLGDKEDKESAKGRPYFKKAADNMFAGADKTIFQRAVELRKQQTHAEELLWGYLRTRPHGFKFRRQHPYLNYILDFYCHSLFLVIEVDGLIHTREDVKQNDDIREKHLKEHGLTVLRFSNESIQCKLEEVIDKIEYYLKEKLNEPGTDGSKSPL